MTCYIKTSAILVCYMITTTAIASEYRALLQHNKGLTKDIRKQIQNGDLEALQLTTRNADFITEVTQYSTQIKKRNEKWLEDSENTDSCDSTCGYTWCTPYPLTVGVGVATGFATAITWFGLNVAGVVSDNVGVSMGAALLGIIPIGAAGGALCQTAVWPLRYAYIKCKRGRAEKIVQNQAELQQYLEVKENVESAEAAGTLSIHANQSANDSEIDGSDLV